MALSACGVSGANSVFNANARPDIYQSNAVLATSTTFDIMGNDGGSGATIEDVTDGYFGSVTIGTGALDVTYDPFTVNTDTYFADWFTYRIRANNYSWDQGRVAVRFAESPTDTYEPDDFQEFARPIRLRLGIPTRETHTSDITNPVNPGAGGSFLGSGQTIGGDEDWFRVDVPVPSAGNASWLRIDTILPNVASAADHNACVITMMDQWGFMAADLLGAALIETAGSGPGSNDSYGGTDATQLDRGLVPDTATASVRYLVRINPENGHKGEYEVEFTLYEAPPPVIAAPVGVSTVKLEK